MSIKDIFFPFVIYTWFEFFLLLHAFFWQIYFQFMAVMESLNNIAKQTEIVSELGNTIETGLISLPQDFSQKDLLGLDVIVTEYGSSGLHEDSPACVCKWIGKTVKLKYLKPSNSCGNDRLFYAIGDDGVIKVLHPREFLPVC